MAAALKSKLPDVGTTIFTTMSVLAAEHGAINLAQGYPDFQPPAALTEAVVRHLKAGRNQYAPMTGVPALREAIAAKLADLYRVEADPDTEITVTSGATEALMCAITAMIRPGDEVIVFDPAYDSYEPAVTLAGGKTVHVALRNEDFGIDWSALESALSSRTRMVIVNTPHNPGGAVLTPTDLDRLAAVTADSSCLILSDEVYEHIVFDGARHASVLAHKALAGRAMAVFSFGKTYHVTGWKVGYCVAPPALSAEFRKVHQYNTFSTVTPVQYALADMLREHPEHHLELPAFYEAKRDAFADMLGDTAFEPLPCRGTFFQLADYSAVRDVADVEFARWLTETAGVAVIPISVFYQSPPEARVVRFCFAKETGTLEQAAARLRAIEG